MNDELIKSLKKANYKSGVNHKISLQLKSETMIREENFTRFGKGERVFLYDKYLPFMTGSIC